MQWCVDTAQKDAIAAFAAELDDHLRRHAEHAGPRAAEIDDAIAFLRGEPQGWWAVDLSWDSVPPVLELQPLPDVGSEAELVGVRPWAEGCCRVVDGGRGLRARRRAAQTNRIEIHSARRAPVTSFDPPTPEDGVAVSLDPMAMISSALTGLSRSAAPLPVHHRFRWPPVAPEPSDEDSSGFRLDMEVRLPRDRASVPAIRHLVQLALEELGSPREQVDDVALALTEACANVVEHARPTDLYAVSVHVDETCCRIEVGDLGDGFDTVEHADAMVTPMSTGGRGIPLMHALMDDVRFERGNQGGTVVHLVKYLKLPEESLAHPPTDPGDAEPR